MWIQSIAWWFYWMSVGQEHPKDLNISWESWVCSADESNSTKYYARSFPTECGRCYGGCHFSWHFFDQKVEKFSRFIFIDAQKCLVADIAFITIRLLNISLISMFRKRAMGGSTWTSWASSPQTLKRVEILAGRRVGKSLFPVISCRHWETQPKRVFTSNALTFWRESSIWLLRTARNDR